MNFKVVAWLPLWEIFLDFMYGPLRWDQTPPPKTRILCVAPKATRYINYCWLGAIKGADALVKVVRDSACVAHT